MFQDNGDIAKVGHGFHRANVGYRPEIYNLALERLGLEPTECVVVEDNRNGLMAAKGAGMHCIVTTNGYTEDEDFSEADLVVPELGDPPHVRVDLERIRSLVETD